MPADYTIDKSLKMVFSVAHGEITDQDAFSHQERLRNDPDFDSSFSQLFDCTKVTKAEDMSTDAIYELARRNPFTIHSKRAFVSPKKLLYGLFRIFQILTVDYPDDLNVFKDMSEAREFLGLSD